MYVCMHACMYVCMYVCRHTVSRAALPRARPAVSNRLSLPVSVSRPLIMHTSYTRLSLPSSPPPTSPQTKPLTFPNKTPHLSLCQAFRHGAMCGGGAGPRRADVIFECGLTNQVLSVEEPSTCSYRCACARARMGGMEGGTVGAWAGCVGGRQGGTEGSTPALRTRVRACEIST